MPVVLLERLPLPSLKTYTTISVGLLACAIYFANEVVREANERDVNITEGADNISLVQNGSSELSHEAYAGEVADALMGEAWCVWTMINSAYCVLLLFGKLIQKIVFGELRVSEQTHMKDRFWNFVFYKFIFIFGVMNVQNMEEVFEWSAWFSLLGFLHLLCQLCKDRFEYVQQNAVKPVQSDLTSGLSLWTGGCWSQLSFSPTTPAWTHAKVLMLLTGIMLFCGALHVICVLVGINAGINIFAFMIAECALLGLKSTCVMTRYVIHLWDMHHEGVWEHRASLVYYTDFLFDMATLSIEFAHHLHMLLWGNIFLSMASLVICMQLRYLFHEFQRRIRRHKNYLRVVRSMEEKFPMASPSDLDSNNDNCAICWDKMEAARTLPCGHFFHNSCLRSWLEQDTSCPTCRTSLGDGTTQQAHANPQGPGGDAPPAAPIPNPVTFSNHFFHFDGSRYISWLPSFSVEVTHTPFTGAPVPQQNRIQTSQLDNMARQVLDLFPHMPIETIMEDLQITRSVEITIENILEERVTAPPTAFVNRTNSESLDEPSTAAVTSGNASAPTEPAPAASINFIQDDNIPDLSAEDSPEESAEEPSSPSGFRFSKSPVEREAMLQLRKESLISQARRRFNARQSPSAGSSQSAASASSEISQTRDGLEYHTVTNSTADEHTDDITRRRELAFSAAQRRINSS